MINYIMSKQTRVFKFLYEKNIDKIHKIVKTGYDPRWCCDHAFREAAKIGDLDMLKWIISLQDIGLSVDPTTWKNAAFRWASENGHLKVLKWLLSLNDHGHNVNPSDVDNEAFYIAIEEGYFKIVKWLWSFLNLTINQSLISKILRITTQNNHIVIMKWFLTLFENKVDIINLYPMILQIAVDNNHEDIIKYLLSFDFDLSITFSNNKILNDEIQIRNNIIIHKEILDVLDEINFLPNVISRKIYSYLYNSHNIKRQLIFDLILFST